MSENPYSSPIAEANHPESIEATSVALPFGTLAKRVFLAWERLRIVYLLILGIFTLLLCAPSLANFGATAWRTMVVMVKGAIFANLCYFAGPASETYLRWLGYDRPWVRWFLFGAGTLFTAALALMALSTTLLPDQM